MEEKKLIGHKLGEGGIDLLPPRAGVGGLVAILGRCPACGKYIYEYDEVQKWKGLIFHAKCFHERAPWKPKSAKFTEIIEKLRKEAGNKPLSDEQVSRISLELDVPKSIVVSWLDLYGISHMSRAKVSFVNKLQILLEGKEEKTLSEQEVNELSIKLGVPKGILKYWLKTLGYEVREEEERKVSFAERVWQATKECAKDRVLGPQEILELMKRLNAPSPNWIAYYLRSFEAAKKCKLLFENGTLVRIDLYE